MFGGGLNEDQKIILDMCVVRRRPSHHSIADGPRLTRFDQAGEDGQGEGGIKLPALRRQLIQFERAVKKNQEMRVKFPDEPEKCVGPLILLCLPA